MNWGGTSIGRVVGSCLRRNDGGEGGNDGSAAALEGGLEDFVDAVQGADFG